VARLLSDELVGTSLLFEGRFVDTSEPGLCSTVALLRCALGTAKNGGSPFLTRIFTDVLAHTGYWEASRITVRVGWVGKYSSYPTRPERINAHPNQSYIVTSPRVPRNDKWIRRALTRVFDGLTVPQGDHHEILRFVNRELPRFEQSDTTYLIVGSYRSEYRIRLRGFAHALGMASNADTIILGDTIDLDTDVVPEFDVKLNLLSEGADFIAGVYEKEDGGESLELGFLRGVFAQKTHVLPRDYAGLNRDRLDDRDDIRQAALEVYFSDGPEAKHREELLGLLNIAEEEGIEINERELVDFLQERDGQEDSGPATYSWVHLSFFKRFDALEQCYPWFTETELIERSQDLPGPNRPQWEYEYSLDDFN